MDPPKKKRRIRSMVWCDFTDIGNYKAKCHICCVELSHRGGSTYNLKRHLDLKHNCITVRPENASGQDTYSSPIGSDVKNKLNNPVAARVQGVSVEATENNTSPQPSTSGLNGKVTGRPKDVPINKSQRKKQGMSAESSAKDCLVRPTSIARQKDLDSAVLQLITMDMQPISIVTEPGFIHLMEVAAPGYRLPNRKTISNTLIPRHYEQLRNSIRDELKQVQAVCLTTDCWTSRATDCYTAVTAHYITDDFVLKSSLLDCFEMTEQHTAVNLRDELKRVAQEWDIDSKIECVVTDGSAKIKSEVPGGQTDWRQLTCFAHVINIVAKEAIKTIESVQRKVKAIVDHFHHCTVSLQKLKAAMRQMNVAECKLVQDCPTNWNSTFRMFERFCELREPIISTMEQLDLVKLVPLTANDWGVVSHACQLLRPLYGVTEEISSEQQVTVSKVILMVNGLKHLFSQHTMVGTPDEVQQMADIMMESLNRRFPNLENTPLLAEAMLLDPRFKKTGFSDVDAAENCITAVTNYAGIVQLPTSSDTQETTVLTQPQPTTSMPQHRQSDDIKPAVVPSVWLRYDQQVSGMVAASNPQTEAMIEMRQYLEEPFLPRTEDPMSWWRSRIVLYPRLAEVVKRRLCIVATSVPGERIFSKNGLIISDRRSQLSPNKVRQLVFLNANLRH